VEISLPLNSPWTHVGMDDSPASQQKDSASHRIAAHLTMPGYVVCDNFAAIVLGHMGEWTIVP
jgi:hypothetical protein